MNQEITKLQEILYVLGMQYHCVAVFNNMTETAMLLVVTQQFNKQEVNTE